MAATVVRVCSIHDSAVENHPLRSYIVEGVLSCALGVPLKMHIWAVQGNSRYRYWCVNYQTFQVWYVSEVILSHEAWTSPNKCLYGGARGQIHLGGFQGLKISNLVYFSSVNMFTFIHIHLLTYTHTYLHTTFGTFWKRSRRLQHNTAMRFVLRYLRWCLCSQSLQRSSSFCMRLG